MVVVLIVVVIVVVVVVVVVIAIVVINIANTPLSPTSQLSLFYLSLFPLPFSIRLLLMEGMTTCFEWPVLPLTAKEIGIASRQELGPVLAQRQGLALGSAPGQGLDERPTKRGYLVYLNPELADVLPEDNDGSGGDGSLGGDKKGTRDGDGGGDGGGGGVNSDHSSFNLYGIPQTLYKLNADFDTLIRGILTTYH